MAVTGMPSMGGDFATFGAAKGNYRVEITEAGYTEAKSGRTQLVLQLNHKNDPNHPGKEGKKLTKMFQSYPAPGDDDDKRKIMKGMVKRLVFDGFGVKWPTEDKPFDPRILVGKQAWVQITEKDGRTSVSAVAQSPETLPIPKGIAAATASAAPARARRGRGAGAAA